MAETNVAPGWSWDPHRWLAGAEAHGYPGPAVARLRDAANSDLAKVWAWLDKLESPIDRFHFIVAALQGLQGPMMRDELRQHQRIAREWFAFHAQHRALYRLMLTSRKGGENSDYLFAFIGSLIDYDFPLETPGIRAAVGRTANAVLDRDSITPQQVSAVFRAAGIAGA